MMVGLLVVCIMVRSDVIGCGEISGVVLLLMAV